MKITFNKSELWFRLVYDFVNLDWINGICWAKVSPKGVKKAVIDGGMKNLTGTNSKKSNLDMTEIHHDISLCIGYSEIKFLKKARV